MTQFDQEPDMDYDPEFEMDEEALATENEIAAILQEYHKRQMIETLTGPAVSLATHVVLLTLMFVFIVSQPKRKEPAIVVETAEIEEVELEPEVLEEIEDVEKEEEVDNPEISNEPVNEMVGAEDSLLDISDEAPMTDDNMDTEEYLDVVRTNSPLKYSGPLGGRSAAGRSGLVRKYGGSGGGQKAVNRALRWLASVQNEDGSWGNLGGNGHPAHTGIALLVFLAHGETPLSEQYGKTVQTAMRWLANYANNDAAKFAHQKHKGAYGNGMATYAISESYAMTKIPIMQTAMEKCVAIIVDGQQSGGGFDYGYAKGERFDLSVSSWQCQALKAARFAGSTNPGLTNAIQKCIRFLKGPAHADYGKFNYSNGRVGQNLSGAAVLALQLLGAGSSGQASSGLSYISDKRLAAYKEVQQNPAKWREFGGQKLYGWYYDTQAVFNNQNKDKATWKAWRATFEKVLIRAQNRAGYWETKGHIGGADIPGRVLSTCFSALQLEVYYRYLPTFDIHKMDAVSAQDGTNVEDIGAGGAGKGLVIEVEE